MDGIRRFFSGAQLTSDAEFDELADVANIRVVKDRKILVSVVFETIPSFSLIAPLEKNKTNDIVKDLLEVSYKVRELKETNKELQSFIDYFVNKNDLKQNAVLVEVLSTYRIVDNNLNFESSSDVGVEIFNKKLNTLLNFLLGYGLDFTKINIRKSVNTTRIASTKQNVDEEIKKNIVALEKVETVKKVDYTKLNVIKEEPISIKILNETFEPDAKKLPVIQGIIIRVIKPERTGGPWEYYLKDDSGYISCRVWPSKTGEKTASGWEKPDNRPEEYLDTIKVGDVVKIKGKYDFVKGSTNLIFNAYSLLVMGVSKNDKVYDTAYRPRIEVLCHTKFSAFDGLNTANEIIDYSLKSKMPAIGFCDRNNLQGYPDIDTAASKQKQKALYGYEVSVLNDEIPCVINVSETNLPIKDQEYVIFDIETTSLTNEDGDIIEFGAVKTKGGIVISRLDLLIKPSKLVSQFTTELTHITNEMLADKPTFNECAQQILDFVGNSILVAHNGIDFDIRFLNKKLIQNGFKSIENTLIDTLMISRAIHPEFQRHRLGFICRKYKIQYDETVAHRADFDAEVTYRVWQVYINELIDRGITTIETINSRFNTSELHKQLFPSYMNIYAKNKVGLKQLYKLATKSLTEQYYDEKPTLYRKQLNENRENLIICNNPYESSLWDIACNGSQSQLLEEIKFYDYILIAPVHCIQHMINADKIDEETAKKVINKIINTAKEFNKKVIATSHMYYLYNDMTSSYNAFIHTKLLGGKSHRFLQKDLTATPPTFKCLTTSEMLEALNFIEDKDELNKIVIDHTYDFANEFSENKILLNGLFTPKIEGVDTKLRDLVYSTLKEKYGDNPNKILTERIEKELEIIIGKGYAVIYWISYLLVKKSNENGYVVGSRGSVGSSFVALLSKISEVNALEPHYVCPKCKYHEFYEDISVDGFDLPTKMCPQCGAKMISDGHNIPFESFLGTAGAPKVPDIDLNFSDEYQAQAHKFILDMFGKEHAFRAGTILTVAEKTAYAYAKKFLEETKPGEVYSDAEVYALQQYLVDGKRTNGLHAGGMIVVPQDMELEDFCPCSLPPKKAGGEETPEDEAEDMLSWNVTHFDFHAIHDNLLKFDVLGHDIPTIFKHMCITSGVPLSNVDYQDSKVMQLFESLEPLNIKPEQINGETIGTYTLPECSTLFTIGMIKESKPRCFGDLVRISGLSHGTGVWVGNARDLILNEGKQLKDVISFRENMLEYLASNGVHPDDAFKFAEIVRKGKQVKDKEKFEPLVAKLTAAGVPEWYIESCRRIQYLFPKAHATAYMTQAYIAGWYKIYHPLDFYASWFSFKALTLDVEVVCAGPEKIKVRMNEITARLKNKETAKTVTVEEEEIRDVCKVALEVWARGIKFGMIDLEKSSADKFIIDRQNNTLIVPFNRIKGLGVSVAESIVNERNKKMFISKEDLKERTKINKKQYVEMIRLGVLDKFSDTAQMSILDMFNS